MSDRVDYVLEIRKPIDGHHSIVSPTYPGLLLCGPDLLALLADVPLAISELRRLNATSVADGGDHSPDAGNMVGSLTPDGDA